MCLAVTSVFVAPRLQHRFGTLPVIAAVLYVVRGRPAVMALYVHPEAVLAIGVVVAGLFLGINNTLITEAVMSAAPVERGVASAAYSFVRFAGGAVAPWLAGKLGETISPGLPFAVGAAATVLAVGVLLTGRSRCPHLRARAGPLRGRRAEILATADA